MWFLGVDNCRRAQADRDGQPVQRAGGLGGAAGQEQLLRLSPKHQQTCLCCCCAGGRKLVVTDSLFSMDGDWASLRGLVHLRRRHGFLLAIDEAHASLVVGPGCDL